MKVFILWILSLPASYLIVSFFTSASAFLGWIDFLFLAGLLLLITGSALIVLSGGFFSAFVSSWRTFFSAISKKDQVIRESEGSRSRRAVFRKDFTWSRLLVWSGAGYCLLSMALSLFVSAA